MEDKTVSGLLINDISDHLPVYELTSNTNEYKQKNPGMHLEVN